MRAIQAAADNKDHIDEDIQVKMPFTQGPTLEETLLRGESRRAFWRSLALGALCRQDIVEVTGIGYGYVGQLTTQIAEDLVRFRSNAASPMGRNKLNGLISYANKYSEFFLDDAVRRLYP
ncbi:hypothetical protein ACFPM7_28020 [Actinokineospora guangxiensis]|uniref:Uncharacterized protein n=1 Tax=Actinokineospora guangxiensis TaxID=1490288 RepID=A0ABW0EXH3_9PSEU